MSRNYYNEFNPHAAGWLRGLIGAGLIPDGDVDERSIVDVSASDLSGYTQCHFFAGIGGWSHALKLAGWSENRPIWTGSCPCQPFSGSGKRRGHEDERHLWPAFFKLIEKCRPSTVVGEQVASDLGRVWLTAVRLDLEALGYAAGGADLCAAGAGAPHIRQRLYWVANSNGGNSSAEWEQRSGEQRLQPEGGGVGDWVADTESPIRERDGTVASGQQGRPSDGSDLRRMADSNNQGLEGRFGVPERGDEQPLGTGGLVCGSDGTDPHQGFWRSSDWLGCRDGRFRPVEPGTFPLVNGVPGRMGALRAYGNAIVPQSAAAFMKAFMQSTEKENR